MIARMIAMSELALESGAVKGDLRARLPRIADGLAAAVAVSLPWSTSATGILIGLWLIAVVPALDPAALRRELASPAGGLPVLLWGLGALGMLWADVGWSERLAGLSGFHKLLLVPLLLTQFRRGGNAWWAIVGFLASSGVLLAVSWALVLMPGLEWRGERNFGVPVKDYVLQSSIFAICAFGLIAQAVELWGRRRQLAIILLLLAAAFVANIIYVATGRTTLVVMLLFRLLLGFRRLAWKHGLAVCVVGVVIAAAAWGSSPYLRDRVSVAFKEVETASTKDDVSSVGLRFAYWKRSLEFIGEAPVIGHGTGSIQQLFRRDVAPGTAPELITTNPHNQLLAVAIQLGLIGVVVLLVLWVAHFALLRGGTLMAWFGLMIVVENVVGSLFNSYLFEFTQGWLYVLGVGIIGGAVLHGSSTAAAPEGRP
jgi:O-antigen ligase